MAIYNVHKHIFDFFQASALLLKWLIDSLSKCKSADCVELYVNSLQNTQNVKLVPVLLSLVEDNSRNGKPNSLIILI